MVRTRCECGAPATRYLRNDSRLPLEQRTLVCEDAVKLMGRGGATEYRKLSEAQRERLMSQPANPRRWQDLEGGDAS